MIIYYAVDSTIKHTYKRINLIQIINILKGILELVLIYIIQLFLINKHTYVVRTLSLSLGCYEWQKKILHTSVFLFINSFYSLVIFLDLCESFYFEYRYHKYWHHSNWRCMTGCLYCKHNGTHWNETYSLLTPSETEYVYVPK